MKILNSSDTEDNAAILLAYGSNMSTGIMTAWQAFERVVKDLDQAGVIVTKNSSLWSSAAWPDPSQPPYVNAVLQVKTSLQPVDMLQSLHDIERNYGRAREGVRYAPRVLDLDLIAYGREIFSGDNGLILPHPRAHERGFVMGPLAEILPGWVHPQLGQTAAELSRHVTVGVDAHPVAPES